MRKLHLKLDDLRVETFATGEGTSLRGTVRANAADLQNAIDDGTGYAPRTEGTPDCPVFTEPGLLTYEQTCNFCPSEPPVCLW